MIIHGFPFWLPVLLYFLTQAGNMPKRNVTTATDMVHHWHHHHQAAVMFRFFKSRVLRR